MRGSLTIPPCSEGVRWVVLNTAKTMSSDQLAALKKYYENNNRPIQPLNGRTVTNY
ncbi:MAG: carbonic anhydrase family protein [Bdellovibrionales bacterium]